MIARDRRIREEEEEDRRLKEESKKKTEQAKQQQQPVQLPALENPPQGEEEPSHAQTKEKAPEEKKEELPLAEMKWDTEYDKLLENLLEYHSFDFEQVTPHFIEIVVEANAKLGRRVDTSHLTPDFLREKWTAVEVETLRAAPSPASHLDELE
eukprot:TRINITY_DN2489_c0_g1_i2.p1 TRINITY_DN2489_c0_g1~~TRINITY_DN2489_c0_g1_i2.p1  ORF type:complete len:153 (-),score=69.44 TRINITY_DN2489_c0_g1_i2:59-517(-)